MRQFLSALALVVRDYDEAIDYYTRVLGFELIEDTDMGAAEPGKRWVRVRPPSVQRYGTVAVFADLYGNQWDLIGPATSAAE